MIGCGDDARPVEQVSTFQHADIARWKPSAHPLGRGRFALTNVTYTPAGLLLTLPAGTLDGGELQGQPATAHASGTFRARMRSAGSPGSISAFFLYRQDRATDSSDELDFEIPGGLPHRVILTVWRRGAHTPADQRTVPLAFDPAAGFHDYAFRRDGGVVRFLVDGEERFRSTRAPTNALPPVFNAWYPTWQTPSAPPQGGQLGVERYVYSG